MNILMFTTGNLMGIARFPRALHLAGFDVGLLCAPDSYISKTRFVSRTRFLRAHRPSMGLFVSMALDLVDAIEDFAPKLIIPGDERAVYCLHKIVRMAEFGRLGFVASAVLDVIRFSLCDQRYYAATNNKNITQRVARGLGINVPAQIEIRTEQDALAAAAELNYPVVLKKGIGEAGLGVKICPNEASLLGCMKTSTFREAGRFKQIVRRALGREISWVPDNTALAVQQYVQGTAAIHCVAALQGRVLAGYTAVKECIHPNPTGQATRIRFIDQPEITTAIAKFVAHAGYTGFGDFEFMIETETSKPYFLECNPRPSTMFHLGEMIDTDLARAMHSGLAGHTVEASSRIGDQKVIVLFPQELRRDPTSPFLDATLHDVPWDDPGLLQAYLTA